MSPSNQKSEDLKKDVTNAGDINITHRIVSDEFRQISIFSFKGKAGGLELREIADKESSADFFADNEEYIYALFKVLNRANERGWFDHLKTEEVEEIKEYV